MASPSKTPSKKSNAAFLLRHSGLLSQVFDPQFRLNSSVGNAIMRHPKDHILLHQVSFLGGQFLAVRDSVMRKNPPPEEHFYIRQQLLSFFQLLEKTPLAPQIGMVQHQLVNSCCMKNDFIFGLDLLLTEFPSIISNLNTNPATLNAKIFNVNNSGIQNPLLTTAHYTNTEAMNCLLQHGLLISPSSPDFANCVFENIFGQMGFEFRDDSVGLRLILSAHETQHPITADHIWVSTHFPLRDRRYYGEEGEDYRPPNPEFLQLLKQHLGPPSQEAQEVLWSLMLYYRTFQRDISPPSILTGRCLNVLFDVLLEEHGGIHSTIKPLETLFLDNLDIWAPAFKESRSSFLWRVASNLGSCSDFEYSKSRFEFLRTIEEKSGADLELPGVLEFLIDHSKQLNREGDEKKQLREMRQEVEFWEEKLQEVHGQAATPLLTRPSQKRI